MSGLVTQTRQKGRGSGLSQGFTFRSFTTDGSTTIAKPYGCSIIVIECIGAGGSGGGGLSAGGAESGGGGGGGGALARMSFPAESLGETLTIAVGCGGATASAGGNGDPGGATTVTDDDSSKVILTAGGGGKGNAPSAGSFTIGGSGGGTGGNPAT